MKIEFFYYQDCPSYKEALNRLRKALACEKIQEDIQVTEVNDEQHAIDLNFIGSPTIRINGLDMEQPQPGPPYRCTCRVYTLDDGRISPVPSLEMIRRALVYSSQG